jgi:hypothetical protein
LPVPVIEKLKTPATVGIPVIVPVVAFKVKPFGIEPMPINVVALKDAVILSE